MARCRGAKRGISVALLAGAASVAISGLPTDGATNPSVGAPVIQRGAAPFTAPPGERSECLARCHLAIGFGKEIGLHAAWETVLCQRIEQTGDNVVVVTHAAAPRRATARSVERRSPPPACTGKSSRPCACRDLRATCGRPKVDRPG